MKSKRRKRKIVPYRRRFHLNIGIIIFAFVFIYFVIYLISYLTQNNIAVYEVQYGQIAKNKSYTGLALRPEEVFYANDAGSVNYYKKEGDKAGYNDLICSVDKAGNISEEISQAGMDTANLSEEELLNIQNTITTYVSGYSGSQFYNVYSFKEGVNAQIQENLYVNALDSLTDKTTEAVSQNTFSFVRTTVDGILALYTDGYEDVSADNFKAEMYNPASYVKTNLKGNAQVTSGQALYKIATSEDWTLMVPITEKEAKEYQKKISEGSDSFVLHVKFRKDNTETNATTYVRNIDGTYFLQLNLNNSMIRFLSDRYIEVELGADESKGLKLPNTAIAEKEFLVIPKEYVGKGDNSSSSGVIKITKDKHGKEKAEFIATDLYYDDEANNTYYISEASLSVGDTIQLPNSTQQYTIKDKDTRKGVYNVDKGYAVFRLIDVLAENEEYTIVKTGTKYGISLYDHIAMDGSGVNEGEFLN